MKSKAYGYPMSLRRPTIVLFDMDGTTVRHVNPRLLGVLEFLDDMMYRLGRLLRGKKQQTIMIDEDTKSRGIIVHRILHKLRRKPVEQIVQPCPGIYAVLNFLKDHKIPLGIVSNGLGKGYGHDILKKFHLDDSFQAQLFKEDIGRSKPHPDPLLRALKEIKDPLTPNDVVWYIGDRHKDITAALAADKALTCQVIPLSYGLNAAVAILEKGVGPDHIIMNYTEFLNDIQALFDHDTHDKEAAE